MEQLSLGPTPAEAVFQVRGATAANPTHLDRRSETERPPPREARVGSWAGALLSTARGEPAQQ